MAGGERPLCDAFARGTEPRDWRVPLPSPIGRIIAVASQKGGVGKMLASCLGMSPETLSRVRARQATARFRSASWRRE